MTEISLRSILYLTAMKIIACIFLTAVVLSSCSSPTAIHKKLADTDSLVIIFNVPDTDSVINTVSTTESKAIKKITSFVDGKASEGVPCGYDGHMNFFSKQQLLLQVVFSYHKDDCRQFIFDLDNKVQTTNVNGEAQKFLQSLAEGKNWY